MSSSLRSVLRSSAFQVFVLTVSLWALDLMQLTGDSSRVSFQLIFGMLAPHVFSATPIFASLFIYVSITVISSICQCPITHAEPLHLLAAHYSALLAAALISLLLMNRRITRRTKTLFGLYYASTVYIAATHAYAMRFTSPYLIIWPALLLLLPLLFWRLRPFVPRFWQMAPLLIVYIPLRFAGYRLLTEYQFGTTAGSMGALWEQLFPRVALFEGIVLPFGPYILMAIIAAVILTHLQGWNLRAHPHPSEGSIIVSEIDEQDEE